MAPAYLRFTGRRPVPSIMTVHNLAFQGQFPISIFPGLGLPGAALSLDGVEYYGGVGFLKGGLQRPMRSPRSARPMRRKSARRNSAWASTG